MTGLTYTQVGDYLLPDIRLKPRPNIPLGKYGMMRLSFLKEHNKILYNSLLLKERLYPHLLEIDETANKRLVLIMRELEIKNPPPDKATNQMGWVSHMNSLKAQAEEFIFAELIYD
jgi:hypothetical protein